ncbi:uncharacterized protein DNG_05826 [Cephalotrichum gorgonifer]|uniref:Zn(2)-C6 fungal-type domain-containing protein n=1 Tax=Cephalotrichum gorgonifer TaxID=2041049 RepID=A0AAE8N0J6_9PEZI|nr:uncharacterized protein DNG_05826 [Cephalotrichum gorgonifer]
MGDGQMTTARTGCATCKDHAISCDRAKPNCSNCSRSNRKCQWYGPKLSWPRANDRRRAVISKTPPPSSQRPAGDQNYSVQFVNTSHWDIELHHSLESSLAVPTRPLLDVPMADVRTCPLLGVPMPWVPPKLGPLDRDLLEYSSASLATFGHDATALGNILARIALHEETASTAALLQALLAFSSLHRYGVQSQAVELKIAALRSLAEASAAPSLDVKETMQHIGAGMLLCSYEVHQSSCTSGHWTGYLSGVKTVISAFSVEKLLQFGSDAIVLLDWISNLPPPIFSILNLLSQLCDAVSSSTIPPGTFDSAEDYKGFLRIMDWRIRSLPIRKATNNNDNISEDEMLTMQLFQLAMLLYLTRSSEGLIYQPITAQENIDKAFAIFPRLSSCKQQFPIHVIGCEARTDEQRAVILDIIFRTEKMSSSRSFNYCKRTLQAIWAQDDLAYGKTSLCIVIHELWNTG